MPARTRLWTPVFALLWGSSFLVFLSFYLLLPVLPLYVLQRGIPESVLGFVIGAFALTAMVLKPWVGWALDWRGRRGLVVAGAALFALATLLYPLAASATAFLVVRMLHGAGMGLFPTAGVAVVADLAPPERRGEAMGLFGMASNLAMAVGPVLGVAVEQGVGFVPLCLGSAALAGLGTALATRLPETGRPGSAPPFRLTGLFAPAALHPAAVTLVVFLPYGAVLSFLPLLMRARAVGNPGAFFTLMALALLAVRTRAGRLSDRWGRRAVAVPALVTLAAALFLLAVASHAAWTIYLAGILFGLALGAAQPVLIAWTADTVEPRDRGKALGTFYTAWELGIGGGSIVFGLLLPLGGFEALYAGGALLALGGAALALAGRRR